MKEHDIDALIVWKYDTYVNGLDAQDPDSDPATQD